MKLLFTSLGVVLFVLASWFAADFYLFRQQRLEHEVLIQKISEQECVSNEFAQIEKQGNYQKKYDAILNAELDALEKKIPPTAEVSKVLALVSKIASESKVILHDFQMGKVAPKNTWFELPVRVTLSGSFPDLVSFLERIAQQNRLMVVQDLKYGPQQVEIRLLAYFGNWRPEMAPVLAASYRCGEYVIPANIDAVLVIPKISGTVQKLMRDPFIVPEGALHLVGVIDQSDEWLALLEDDRGKGRAVKVGDLLPNGFVVKQIDKNSVSILKGSETKRLTWSNE